MSRELTRKEKTAIRSLVVTWCANYDREYGCLPLDSDCYMLGKCWTGSYCRYFRESVLPLDPALEVALMSEGPRPDFKICPVCGGPVPPDRRQAYCSAACAKKAHRRQQREYMRKKRGAWRSLSNRRTAAIICKRITDFVLRYSPCIVGNCLGVFSYYYKPGIKNQSDF